jgi:hypothetical protein
MISCNKLDTILQFLQRGTVQTVRTGFVFGKTTMEVTADGVTQTAEKTVIGPFAI